MTLHGLKNKRASFSKRETGKSVSDLSKPLLTMDLDSMRWLCRYWLPHCAMKATLLCSGCYLAAFSQVMFQSNASGDLQREELRRARSLAGPAPNCKYSSVDEASIDPG